MYLIGLSVRNAKHGTTSIVYWASTHKLTILTGTVPFVLQRISCNNSCLVLEKFTLGTRNSMVFCICILHFCDLCITVFLKFTPQGRGICPYLIQESVPWVGVLTQDQGGARQVHYNL